MGVLWLRLPPSTLESTVHSGRQIGAWLARPWVQLGADGARKHGYFPHGMT